MGALQTVMLQCPHCWEHVEKLADCSVAHETIVEDCSVCCGPMVINISMDEDEELGAEARMANG